MLRVKFILNFICFLSFLANESNSKYKCREAIPKNSHSGAFLKFFCLSSPPTWFCMAVVATCFVIIFCSPFYDECSAIFWGGGYPVISIAIRVIGNEIFQNTDFASHSTWSLEFAMLTNRFESDLCVSYASYIAALVIDDKPHMFSSSPLHSL